MIQKHETVAIGWCDNGLTDGKFTQGLMTTLLMGPSHGLTFSSGIRVQGNQIARQRQTLFDQWADVVKTDWLLWVDSDIVLTLDSLAKLWKNADKINRPVISGVYFISKENEETLMRPLPAVFNNISEYQIEYIHPLPEDQVIKVDNAGFGFVLMHKSIVSKIRSVSPGKSLFMEVGDGTEERFIGEDIVFFRRMKEAGIPLHVHTGALVKHMKRFSLDVDYYRLYWKNHDIEDSQED